MELARLWSFHTHLEALPFDKLRSFGLGPAQILVPCPAGKMLAKAMVDLVDDSATRQQGP